MKMETSQVCFPATANLKKRFTTKLFIVLHENTSLFHHSYSFIESLSSKNFIEEHECTSSLRHDYSFMKTVPTKLFTA
jgi:hypothetical protein